MKTYLLFAASVLCLVGRTSAQVYSPIATTGYTLDAVAEALTAQATTGGSIDGSNYVLYSAAYGAAYGGGTTYGLPNSGLLTNGGRSYQLQAYTGVNMMYLPNATSDTLLLVTPASYPSLSLAGFSTENPGTMNVKVRFTDGTSQLFSGIVLDDWFGASTNTVVVGVDRVTRNTGVPNYNGSNPKVYYVDLNLSCANRLKLVQRVIIQNASVSVNPRLCIMALSGSSAATYTVNTTPVTCAGGANGSATLSIGAGVSPFTYTWSTTPPQTTSVVNLPVGPVTYTVTDGSGCTYSSSVLISQNIQPTAPITVIASQNPVCTGSTLTLTTGGAVSYTWSNSGSGSSTTVAPVSTTVYSVTGTTSANCTVAGTLTVNTTPLPVLTFTSVPAKLCLNAGAVALTANPSGGTFSGTGISFGSFFPNLAGASTQTITYTYTDANNCTNTTSLVTVVSTPTTVIAFSIPQSTICSWSPTIALTATPAGGVFTGTGVVGSSFSPTLAGIGTRTISYSYTDANNCTASGVASISVRLCSTVGLNELSQSTNYQLYPNPNNGSFIIKADVDTEVALVNELGQTVQTVKLSSANNHQVQIENLSSGIYFLSAKDQLLKQKVVVTK